MKRIEIHLTEEETKALDQIAVVGGRSRKNLCETEIRKLIERGKKIRLPIIFNRRTNVVHIKHNGLYQACATFK